MGSPFPGMDPYIEARHLFDDLQICLIAEIKRMLSEILPDRYVARAGERSYVALAQVDDDPDQSHFLAEAAVNSTRGSASTSVLQPPPGAVLMRAPIATAEYREAFLEIRQVDPDHKLVTGIEVLSPSNKDYGSKGWRLYYRKRRAFLGGYANLVEIDLLRGGRRMPMSSPWPDSPYYVLTSYKKPRRKCFAWPAYSIKPLPPITIPLNPPDPDISLEIQPLVDAIYTRSRYAYDIDYRRPLSPPLSAVEEAWLEERLREQKTKS
jgi:hypothetical protein